ncbi:MAG: hypothetical protein ACFFD2_06080 [Promethearchaeota archaeon]
MLSNTYYFISNKRILSIRKDLKTKQLVNVLISDVEYYFFEKIKRFSKYILHLNFKVTHLNEKNLKNSVLICRSLKDIKLKERVQIIRDEGWTCKVNEFIYRLNNIEDKEELSKVLHQQLNIKEKDLPSNWKKTYGVTEFYNPY